MSETIFVGPPWNGLDITISREEDWAEALPMIAEGNDPLNLTGKVLEYYIRPSFDHETLIKKLTSATASASRILIEDVAQGLASIIMPRSAVQSDIPASPSNGWAHFLVLREVAGAGFAYRRIWRGRLFVHDGNTDE